MYRYTANNFNIILDRKIDKIIKKSNTFSRKKRTIFEKICFMGFEATPFIIDIVYTIARNSLGQNHKELKMNTGDILDYVNTRLNKEL